MTKWQRIQLPSGNYIYQTVTEFGTFQLWHRNAVRQGHTLKYKVWMLYRNGQAVSSSRRYRLTDARRFAEEYLTTLRKVHLQ